MTNALKAPQAGKDPLSTDVGQFALLLQGLLDAGILQLVGPQSTPAAPSAVASGNSGNLNAAYRWITVLVTGWQQSDQSYYVSGFAPSADSAQVTITNNSANISSIATGTGVVIGRAIYRTAAGGAAGTEKFAGIIWDNGTTTWTDNISDANLGTGMPTSTSSPAAYGTAIPASVPTANTTGTYLNGYLRTDANAPNSQTVANPVNFAKAIETESGTGQGGATHWSLANTNGTGLIKVGLDGAQGSGNAGGNFAIWLYDDSGNWLATGLEITRSTGAFGTRRNQLDDGSGNATFAGNVTSSNLGSASGTWTPASGTLNAAAGTVINIGSVPNGAKMYFAGYGGGYLNGQITNAVGITTSSGSAWTTDANGGANYSNGISSSSVYSTTYLLELFDGTYYAYGYLQINGGYLQFVVTSSGTAANAQNTLRWGVA